MTPFDTLGRGILMGRSPQYSVPVLRLAAGLLADGVPAVQAHGAVVQGLHAGHLLVGATFFGTGRLALDHPVAARPLSHFVPP